MFANKILNEVFKDYDKFKKYTYKGYTFEKTDNDMKKIRRFRTISNIENYWYKKIQCLKIVIIMIVLV